MNNMSVMRYAIDAYDFLAPLNEEISGEEFAAAIRKACVPSVKTAIVCDCVSRFLDYFCRRRGCISYKLAAGVDLTDRNDYEK